MGRIVPTNAPPFQIEYGFPTEAEVEAEVLQMSRNREGYHTHLRTENFQAWMREAYPKKDPPHPPQT